MSEYWKSTPKYWCKHCKTYVRDTAFERTQHEATGKHQGNLRRFLRDIHRNNERDERKNQQARNEIERLKGVVSGSSKTGDQQQRPPWKHGLGAGSGAGPATGANAESSASLSANAEQRKRQLAQLVELGVAIPEEFRPDLALAGDWKVVEETIAEEKGHEQDPMAGLNIGVRKRKFEGQEEEEAAGETVMRKGWGLTTRAFPDDGKDIDALLERATELKRKGPNMETPDVKAEREGVVDGSVDIAARKEDPAANDGDVPPIKREERGNGSTVAGTKEKGGAKDVSRSASEALGETSEGIVPAVVFKKRKPKHAR
ncbi:U1 zinc finger domain-containing protein [Histoplasma ohiense]|nr:U1 zinc finger domain-containing protein [Histoplasma ohiense (nom. inval.)]